ncbi:hypothetical protein HYDPIDRAFT_73855, partial [Hydnomerulius pinastri MD-312]
WPSDFSGIDVITNQLTPEHRDPGGAPTFYNLLVSLGKGHEVVLHMGNIDADLAYSPGTAVLLTGRILVHSVPRWGGGERLTVA